MAARQRSLAGTRVGRAALTALATASVVVALAGCSTGVPETTGSPASSGTAGTAAPSATFTERPKSTTGPVAPDAGETPLPTLRPKLSAAENLAVFNAVNKQVLVAHPSPGGRDFIDALVAAGFEKKDMQLTPDKTSIDLAVGSVQFSVLFNDKCLIGQWGPDGVGYHSEVTTVLSTGKCLIGKTRAIDW